MSLGAFNGQWCAMQWQWGTLPRTTTVAVAAAFDDGGRRWTATMMTTTAAGSVDGGR